MTDTLLVQFEGHQAELALIGKMVMAYGELEFALMDLVRSLMDGKTEKAVKVLYRLRSESNRLEVADALIVPDIRDKPFAGHWNEAYSALKHPQPICPRPIHIGRRSTALWRYG